MPAFLVFAIHLLVFSSLFTGLPGPSALGELSGEGAVIGVLAILLAAVLSGAVADVRGIKSLLILAPFAACIFLSYACNADDIATAHFLGREGGEKFFTSLLVVLFYLSAFFAVSCLAHVYGVQSLLLCGSDAALWCGYLLVGEMAVEIVSWFVPPLREIWSQTRGLWVVQGSSQPMFRLVGFAPEPSFGAISAMGLLGFLGAEVAIRGRSGQWPKSRARAVGVLIVILFVLELLLANARTFVIGVAGAALAWALMSRLARRLPAALKSAVIVLGPIPAEALMIWTVLHRDPVVRTTSNISRSVGMITASELWAKNPVFGLGLGQYGFHFRSVVPSWGLGSFEISRYFREDQYDLLAGLPPSFSMFSRVAAELGLLGLAAWLLPPLFAIRRSAFVRPGPLTTVLVCALATQIWAGLSFDSFRNIYYWVWMAMLLAWPRQYHGWTVAAPDVQGAGPHERG